MLRLLQPPSFSCHPTGLGWAARGGAAVSGPDADSRLVRHHVARIVANHGFAVLTSLPAVSGTGQYPQIARDRELRHLSLPTSSRRASGWP